MAPISFEKCKDSPSSTKREIFSLKSFLDFDHFSNLHLVLTKKTLNYYCMVSILLTNQFLSLERKSDLKWSNTKEIYPLLHNNFFYIFYFLLLLQYHTSQVSLIFCLQSHLQYNFGKHLVSILGYFSVVYTIKIFYLQNCLQLKKILFSLRNISRTLFNYFFSFLNYFFFIYFYLFYFYLFYFHNKQNTVFLFQNQIILNPKLYLLTLFLPFSFPNPVTIFDLIFFFKICIYFKIIKQDT